MVKRSLVAGCGVKNAADVNAARRRVLEASVTTRTLAAYRAKVRIFLAFVEEVSGAKNLGDDMKKYWFAFCEEYAARSAKASKAALEAYRSAIAFMQALQEFPGSWAGEEDVRRASSAADYAGGTRRTRRERGAITGEMLASLKTWLIDSNQSAMAEAVEAAWGTHSRIEELMGLRKEDIGPEGIDIPNKAHKRAAMGSQAPRVIKPRAVITKEAWRVLTRRAREAHPGALLFPCTEMRTYQLRAAMKKAAAELGWPVDLDFSVPHCLRHGGIAQQVVEGHEDLVKVATATLVRYGRPNAVRRGGRAAKKAFVASLKKARK